MNCHGKHSKASLKSSQLLRVFEPGFVPVSSDIFPPFEMPKYSEHVTYLYHVIKPRFFSPSIFKFRGLHSIGKKSTDPRPSFFLKSEPMIKDERHSIEAFCLV